MSSSRGSKLSRAVSFFREGTLDEARAAFILVKEIMDDRLGTGKTVKPRKTRTRRVKANGHDTPTGMRQQGTLGV